MRAVLAQHAAYGAQVTKSDLELIFLSLLDAAELPQPRTNAIVEGVEVDAFWASRRLIVELDGWQFHRTRADFERDREKRTALEAAGYRVVEFTHRQLKQRHAWSITQLRRLLA
jgi:very-short-patch-repair endonuclease